MDLHLSSVFFQRLYSTLNCKLLNDNQIYCNVIRKWHVTGFRLRRGPSIARVTPLRRQEFSTARNVNEKRNSFDCPPSIIVRCIYFAVQRLEIPRNTLVMVSSTRVMVSFRQLLLYDYQAPRE